MNKLYNIIEGWINRFRKVHPVKEALFHDRLKICQSNECGMLKLGICTVCGCPVKTKVRVVDEECPENMWNPILYEQNGSQFIDTNELPVKVWQTLWEWFGPGTDYPFISWKNWQEFKEYLRGLK